MTVLLNKKRPMIAVSAIEHMLACEGRPIECNCARGSKDPHVIMKRIRPPARSVMEQQEMV
jgi:hypothetical protein